MGGEAVGVYRVGDRGGCGAGVGYVAEDEGGGDCEEGSGVEGAGSWWWWWYGVSRVSWR